MKHQQKRWLLIIVILVLVILAIKRTGFERIAKDQLDEKQEEKTDQFFDARQSMFENQLKNRDITDKKVLEVMSTVERHKFVPKELIYQAYEDHPLPIGYGQTISQPYIVALMTQSLGLDENDKVLEIGTGSGYQAAVLAEIVDEVYTIEIVKELAESAEKRLKDLGYKNIKVKHGDGYFGLEGKEFDAIIITAAANHLPPPLLKQLKGNGKLIIPLGETTQFQTLTLVTKRGSDLETEFITGVRFVPMIGEAQKTKQ